MSRGGPVRQLFAEGVLGWRRAMRGALPWAVTVVLALCLWVLPGRSDPESVRTGYGLMLAWAFLLICALWSGGTAYALDRERHRLTLAFTKPIHRVTLWWGRCLGTWAPFALAVTMIWGMVAPRPLPAGRTVQRPELPSLDLMAQAELSRLRVLGRVPQGVSEARLLRAVRDDLQGRHTELRHDAPRTYHFRGPAAGAFDAAMPAAFRLSGVPFLGAKDALSLEVEAVSGDRKVTLRPEALKDSGFLLPLPAGFVRPGEAVAVTLKRLDDNGAASVLYREREDLALLFPGQSALANLTAFCAVVLLTLFLAVALGTALGCSFSLPVTLFVGTLAVLAMASASLSPETTVADETANLWARVSASVSWGVAAPFRGLVALNPMRCLFDGEAITLRAVFGLALWLGVPWAFLCSLAAVFSPVRDEEP